MQKATIFVKDGRLRPWWRVLVFAVVAASLAGVLWSVYFIAVGGVEHEPPLLDEEISAEVLGGIAVVITALGMRRFVDRRSIRSLGLSARGPWLRLLLLGACFGAGMQTFAFAIEAVGGHMRVYAFQPSLLELRFLIEALVVLFAGGVLEELCFRGYLFQNFWEGFGLIPAIAITSVLFTALHLGNPSALAAPLQTCLGLLVFALWACCSLLWTKSLWLAVGTHVSWNLFEGPVFGFPVSGLLMPAPTVIVQQTFGPRWLTGGGFGPEAGASALVAMIVGFVVLRRLYVRGAFKGVADTREEYAR